MATTPEAGSSSASATGAAVSRRSFLVGAGGSLLVLTRPGLLRVPAGRAPAAAPPQTAALSALGRTSLRGPDTLAYPHLAPGTDTMPQIQNIVVLMMENHSYDNLLGMLGRGRGQRRRGDGFTIGRNGLPTATNPYPDGRVQHAFHMPTTCQHPGRSSVLHHRYRHHSTTRLDQPCPRLMIFSRSEWR